MKLLFDMNDFDAPGCVAALGTFDGVHLGHAHLLRETVELAREMGIPAAALTFDRHPLSLIRPEATPKALTSPEEKRALLAALGLDILIEQPFTREFANLTPECFFERLFSSLHPRALVVGFNYTFGKQGQGGAELLEALCHKKGFSCRIMEPVCVDGAPVSSSRIRSLMDAGKIAQAERLLGHPPRNVPNCREDCKNLK